MNNASHSKGAMLKRAAESDGRAIRRSDTVREIRYQAREKFMAERASAAAQIDTRRFGFHEFPIIETAENDGMSMAHRRTFRAMAEVFAGLPHRDSPYRFNFIP